jgi:hypothetical protein
LRRTTEQYELAVQGTDFVNELLKSRQHVSSEQAGLLDDVAGRICLLLQQSGEFESALGVIGHVTDPLTQVSDSPVPEQVSSQNSQCGLGGCCGDQ